MNRIFTQTAQTAILATFAFAQAPQTSNQAAPIPGTEKPAAEQSAAAAPGSGQTYRGVVMDASCQAIQSRGSAHPSADASRSRVTPRTTASSTVPAAAGVTPGATTGASPPSSTDASAPAAIKEAAKSPSTAATTGVNPNHAGQPPANTTTPPAEQRSTASSSVTTYSGPSATPSAPGARAATTHIGGTDNPTGERSRSADTSAESADAGWIAAREKYKDCRVTPTTTSFALLSNGQLYMVDDANGLLRRRINMPAKDVAEWHTVTITGNITGDRISTSSVQ